MKPFPNCMALASPMEIALLTLVTIVKDGRLRERVAAGVRARYRALSNEHRAQFDALDPYGQAAWVKEHVIFDEGREALLSQLRMAKNRQRALRKGGVAHRSMTWEVERLERELFPEVA